jgi:hypothetical protein
VSAPALLAELEATGVRLSLAGDDLRYRTQPGVSIGPYREQITAHKPALLALLAVQDEIVAAASVARAAFDRQHFDSLWAEWHALQVQGTV